MENQIKTKKALKGLPQLVILIAVSIAFAFMACESQMTGLDETRGSEPKILAPGSQIFIDYEQQASFRGGERALLEFLDQNVRYPDGYEGCAQGRVVVTFTIDLDGSIINPRVTQSLDKPLDDEALRVVRLMPKWRPAKENGECKRVEYSLPIPFKLK